MQPDSILQARFTPQTRRDLRAIEEYISRDNPVAALPIVELIRSTVQTIARVPRSGETCDHLSPELRRALLRRYRYVIYFRLIPQGIPVVRIVQGSRNAQRLFPPDEAE